MGNIFETSGYSLPGSARSKCQVLTVGCKFDRHDDPAIAGATEYQLTTDSFVIYSKQTAIDF